MPLADWNPGLRRIASSDSCCLFSYYLIYNTHGRTGRMADLPTSIKINLINAYALLLCCHGGWSRLPNFYPPIFAGSSFVSFHF